RLGLSYAFKGMGDQALAELQAASLQDPNPESWSALGYGLARFGKLREASEILERLQASPAPTPGSWYQMAIVTAALGCTDQAFELLSKACEERSGTLVSLKVEPMFDSLRSDTRFDRILRRVGLVG